ncbi:EF-hand domain-containing family member C2 [Melanotaenia boesemani]|uniref:EF-hand domain-containing family member C2 n=1 Tax=Melanotaenia boesemani TaxID=1250792 RepID=UPI001C04DA5F|nr:EF-hand domain-containing family member C2 [Melanotaenia boesemani]
MALPFLPGNSPNVNLGKERFHKSQHFECFNGLPMLVELDKPGIGGERLFGKKMKSKYSVYPKEDGRNLPSWIAFDKKVLCFEAYFHEEVLVAQDETYRIRKCKIYFYLEDDTIQVVEPQRKNSGIPQGTLIHRHRIRLPPPNDDDFYNIFHFNINQQMVFYSRTFTLTNCDAFTRNFLTKLGVRLNDPATVPDDPFSKQREQLEESMKPLRPYERHNTLKKFLDHDRKVLRFFCFWDNPVYRDPQELVLHYFLADDTVSITEVIPSNPRRPTVSTFLRRGKLPKHAPAQMKQLGQVTDRTVLNVLASESQGARFMLDSLNTGAVDEDFYKDSDLVVGGKVNVWGRKVIITDCDEFTKNYYRSKYGIEDFTPVQYKAPLAPKPPMSVPPYNGFGSEEDSLSSCQSILLKPHKKDFHKFMKKDGNVLNFRAKMMTTDLVDRDRVFIISFYLCDDSMSVFEQPQKNSGILGGKFLERCRVKKPGQELFKSKPSEYFTAQDLHVGVILSINGHNFHLLDADEYTLKYMEQHADEFPKANTGSILSKLRSISEGKQSEIRKFLTLSDPTNTGFIPYESFRGLLMGLDCGLSEHEILVLGRCFSENKQPEVDVGLMLAVAQDILKRKHFEKFPEMVKVFSHHDRRKIGRLSTKETRTFCKAFQLPVPGNLLESLLSKFCDGDYIDYHAFIAGLNWLEHPAPPVMPEDILRFEVNLRFDNGGAALKNINYSTLLQDVFSFNSNIEDPTTTVSA